jgi:polar amino acid transport system substrate-binding protein
VRYLLLPLVFIVVGPASSAETLRILANDTEPFFYLEDGEPAGLEYEILRYFAESREQDLEIIWVERFSEILPMLERGEGDIAAATLTITQERLERFDFSESYFPVRVMLVERDGESAEDLESLSGSSLATIRGATYEKLLSAIPGVKLIYAESEKEMFDWVVSGKARALATDSAVAFRFLEEFDTLTLGLSLTEEQQYGFAVANESPLGKALSENINQLKASGIYFRLLERHLGSKAVEVVKAGKVR